MKHRIYLSLGTNMGDRMANINKAIELLSFRLSTHYLSLSSIVESKSWGFEGNDFLNCVISYETQLKPLELLSICKEIEVEMGRIERIEYGADGKRIYHDRPIDIDILLYDDLTVNLPELTIPHPLIEQRDFIKGPLMEILEGNN